MSKPEFFQTNRTAIDPVGWQEGYCPWAGLEIATTDASFCTMHPVNVVPFSMAMHRSPGRPLEVTAATANQVFWLAGMTKVVPVPETVRRESMSRLPNRYTV